jgi:hypothetical protein
MTFFLFHSNFFPILGMQMLRMGFFIQVPNLGFYTYFNTLLPTFTKNWF